MNNIIKKQKYFIDNARPIEFEYILRTIQWSEEAEVEDIISRSFEKFAFKFQVRYFDSFNRLNDLDLISKHKENHKHKVKITTLGKTVKEILNYDRELYFEIVHFLHYAGFECSSSKKPYLWSYKKLCDLLWEKESFEFNVELASEISLLIQERFGTTKTPFDPSTIQKFFQWIKPLNPSVLSGNKMEKRYINWPELFLLSMDLYYKTNSLNYNDPILINQETKIKICKPFFIVPNQFEELKKNCMKIWPSLREQTAFQGISLILGAEFNIINIINIIK